MLRFISKIYLKTNIKAKKGLGLLKINSRNFSGTNVQATKRSHGGLKDQDRIFTNVYNDGTAFVEGALKRVNFI
jgi:hypothetical protein